MELCHYEDSLFGSDFEAAQVDVLPPPYPLPSDHQRRVAFLQCDDLDHDLLQWAHAFLNKLVKVLNAHAAYDQNHVSIRWIRPTDLKVHTFMVFHKVPLINVDISQDHHGNTKGDTEQDPPTVCVTPLICMFVPPAEPGTPWEDEAKEIIAQRRLFERYLHSCMVKIQGWTDCMWGTLIHPTRGIQFIRRGTDRNVHRKPTSRVIFMPFQRKSKTHTEDGKHVLPKSISFLLWLMQNQDDDMNQDLLQEAHRPLGAFLGRGATASIFERRPPGKIGPCVMKLTTPDVAQSFGEAKILQFIKDNKATRHLALQGKVPLLVSASDNQCSLELYPKASHADEPSKDTSSRRPFTLDDSIDLVNTIQTLHSVGIVHRDIDPNNILIGKTHEQHVLLNDFGFALRYKKKKKKKGDHHASAFPFHIEESGYCGSKHFCSPRIAMHKGLHGNTSVAFLPEDDLCSLVRTCFSLLHDAYPPRDIRQSWQKVQAYFVERMPPAWRDIEKHAQALDYDAVRQGFQEMNNSVKKSLVDK